MKRTQLLVLCLVLLVLLVPTGCIKSKPQPTSVPTTASGQVPTKAATATNAVVATATKSSAVAQQGTATVAATGQPTAMATPTSQVKATTAPEVNQATAVPTTAATKAPTSAPTSAPTVAPTKAAEQQQQQTGEQTYQVRWGDTLARIAKQFGVTTQAIMARNPQITNPNLIKAGWTLIIPASGTTPQPTAAPQTPTFYIVQRGDTLSGIARRFGTTTTALRQANPFITNPNIIIPGQRLTIPGTSGGNAVGTHVVKAGETLSGIARLYNKTTWAFVVRNNLANANLIFVGQVLIIPE